MVSLLYCTKQEITLITEKQYSDLDKAYSYFNKHLFGNKLPECLITLNRKARTYGYYHHEKFQNRENKEVISEISLNPDGFNDREDIDILSTLAHEMTHVQQFYFGNPPRRGYHDRQFSEMMYEIGLQTSSTGEPGAKSTGQRMSHYIIEGGKFEIVAKAFLLNGSKLHWNSRIEEKEVKECKKTREKFTCPTCHQSAWAKKTAKLACGNCLKEMIIEEN